MPDPKIKNRLTVVETVYHQTATGEPDSIASSFFRELDSDEQPYRRKTKVGEEWTPLDLGWIKEAGMLVICNDEGKGLTKIPTPEEKEELAKKVLLLGFAIEGCHFGAFRILPGESFRGSPTTNLYLLSCYGVTRFTVYAIPR